ncbi:hypothetical protein [Streptomyces sp. NPDC020747]|uniref:hypothetical protein n=1 Tax=Streptomyces sp. NPDC020747 TaxID=3365086 RepID=UPI00379D72B7
MSLFVTLPALIVGNQGDKPDDNAPEGLTSSLGVGLTGKGLGQCELVHGQLSGPIPKDMVLGVFVKDDQPQIWAPAEVDPQRQHTWLASAHFGVKGESHNGHKFTIMLVILPEADAPSTWGGPKVASFDEKWDVLAKISVKRRDDAFHCLEPHS